jgi:hypothetical protein
LSTFARLAVSEYSKMYEELGLIKKGHAFCRACIMVYLEKGHDDTSSKCLNCRAKIPRDVRHFGCLQTV